MVNISNLKKNRKKQFEALREKAKQADKKQDYQNFNNDPTFWKPTLDDAGNAMAIIRFLPGLEDEGDDYVQLWTHGFRGPTGAWYIENSRTTLGEKDPVFELNGELWNTGIKAKQDQARNQKRQLHYFSNIYVVKDSGNPENNGKVFRFRYGKTIYDMLKAQMFPEFEDESPVDPFDLWGGANFRLKVTSSKIQFPGSSKRVSVPNYDKSSFDSPSPLGTDEEIAAIVDQRYSLHELIAEDKFKSYEELKKRLDRVLKKADNAVREEESEDDMLEDEVPFDTDDSEDDIDALLNKL